MMRNRVKRTDGRTSARTNGRKGPIIGSHEGADNAHKIVVSQVNVGRNIEARRSKLCPSTFAGPGQRQAKVDGNHGHLNLSHDVMKRALQDYEAPRGWDRTVMALGDKDNAEDGLWLISSNPVKDVLTDGRKGQVADHGTHFLRK